MLSQPPNSSPQNGSQNRSIEVLLIEDNPHDAELTLRGLKKHRLINEVTVIGDGAEAVDYLFRKGKYADRPKAQTPRIILLDLKLPKVSGLEILSMMKTNDETRHIPVVVLTSSKEDQDAIESYSLGVNSYIVKPVSFEKFVDAVSQLGFYWVLLNQPGQ